VASRTEGNRGSGGGIVRIAGNIIIDRPIDEVFDFVADEPNEPRYNRRMRRAEKLSAGPVGLGARFHAEIATRRGTAPMTVEITAYEPPRRLASSTRLAAMTCMAPSTSIPFRAAPGCGGLRMFGRTGYSG
jgi:hypothetical protein